MEYNSVCGLLKTPSTSKTITNTSVRESPDDSRFKTPQLHRNFADFINKRTNSGQESKTSSDSCMITSSSSIPTNKKKVLASKFLKQNMEASSLSSAPSTSSNGAGCTSTDKPSSNVPNSARLSASAKKTDNCLLLTIVEGRGLASGEVGFASIDLKCPELQLCQFSDTSGYSKSLSTLYMKNPVEIIFPHTMSDTGHRTKLFQLVSDHMKHCTITTIQRRYFNDKNGYENIQNLCHREYTSVLYECKEKYYALSSAAALIKYVEFIQNVMFAPKSLKIIYYSSIKTMQMDLATVRNLELVESGKDLTESGSLLAALNYTKTLGGYRLLRINILQPLHDLPTILSRQDCVEEISTNHELMFSLMSQISRFLSLDHLLSLCIQLPRQKNVRTAENTITQVIALKHVMELVPTLGNTLKICKSPMLMEYHKLLRDSRYEEILSMINVVVHQDVHFEKGMLQMRTQKLFAIKDGVNVILDVARRSYSEQLEVLREEVKVLSEEHSLPFRVAYSNVRGFYLQLSVPNVKQKPKLSDPFLKVNVFRNTLSCTTEKIIRLNERLKDALSEIYLTGELVLSELIKAIRDHMGVLYRLSEIIATLDLLLSYVNLSKSYNYVRPDFTDTLALKNAYNPLHSRLTKDETIPNHVFCADEKNFVVITGSNMSGKSMYLRKVALIQIIAQIGCFVPAEYATVRLCDHLFTRIGVDDDIQSNSSTFTIEMREMSYIINSLTETSLIIIDELGRGTSVDEGISICFAMCEHLISTKAFTFIATHFFEMMSLEDMYPNVMNIHFEVIKEMRYGNKPSHLFTHKCIRGKSKQQPDGLLLARLSSLPKEVIRDAERVRRYLRKMDKDTEKTMQTENHKTPFITEMESICNRLYEISTRPEIDVKDEDVIDLLRTMQERASKISCELDTDDMES